MITACGWLPHQVDGLEWWSVVDLQTYWADHPPVHELVAAYMGVKPRPKIAMPMPGQPAADASDPSGIGGLVAQFPNGFVPANRPG